MKKQSVSPESYKEYAKVFRIWVDLYNKYRAVLDGEGPDEAPFLEGAIVPGKRQCSNAKKKGHGKKGASKKILDRK